MAEAEDVITDLARHATVFTQNFWRQHRAKTASRPVTRLTDVAPRLGLLIEAVFGTSYRLRTAQLPARPTWLARTFQRSAFPRAHLTLPATDGHSIWLPSETGLTDAGLASERFRTLALVQAMRASRGSAAGAEFCAAPLVLDIYLLMEAVAADAALARLLPGMSAALNRMRSEALAARPPLAQFPATRRPLEAWVRALMAQPCEGPNAHAPLCASPLASRGIAQGLAADMVRDIPSAAPLGHAALFRDCWTGDLRMPGDAIGSPLVDSNGFNSHEARAARSARLTRRPEVREGSAQEDEATPGAWMIPPEVPHEQAEDPFGMQRPTDRDQAAAADEFADMVSELAQARLVWSPGHAPEVLLSDDPPTVRPRHTTSSATEAPQEFCYPEWDCRIEGYRHPGATVRVLMGPDGAQRWVDDTLAQHRSLLGVIGQRFAALRPRRTRRRRQPDGDDIDLEACVENLVNRRAGWPMAQALYCSEQRARRDMAILLLIDVSGSTDGWIAKQRSVIDVEREALLLVCIALAAMGEPFAVQAFSGNGPKAVSLWDIKRFDEPYGPAVALRIAALAPDQYTRTGAALRHASATLMREGAAHRLLLLLSDGKPNDCDIYEGRYGIEDTRQAVAEAKLQGIAPFCLTVERQAASYLSTLFGAHHYALLATPGALPAVLLDWIQRLVKS
ncbi:nitric oxide reductase activation protein NorD [Paucibacter sp. M5-1]|uniref:nitric oxide reductase activation protein NorD n=1 Tax=Paucibacter sp. M5-1 TaxID=3015998 RepID=UPI0022B89159|nr:VWA domain-containing protein [Paucibacter sp. M5-1]MCZ7880533.1 VWA domain-containing protein [Paucibacter sp. M5-1]MCZ7880578.1 VWA domain-containing protein [Paucibacter sp. M5-1]